MKKELFEYTDKLKKDRDIDIFISKCKNGYRVRIEKVIGGKVFDVGTIETSNYKDGLFSTDSHLAHWVEEEFKGEGYGQLLFNIYRMLVFNTNDAIIPEKEYVSKPSRLLFLLKNGYRLESKIIQDSNIYKIILLSNDEKNDLITKSIDILKKKKEKNDFLEQGFKDTYELVLEDEEILSYY